MKFRCVAILNFNMKRIYHYLLSLGAYIFYGRPSRKLIVIGVTGTKGKSTTCRLIASVLEAGGYKVGLLSTVEFQIGNKRWLNDKKMTMLGRGQIHKMLKQMVKAGCDYAVVETSSEGIMQYRHLGLNYDIAVFTNLGTEHSERHGGFENLKKDKGKLFSALSKNKKIINGKNIKKVIVVNGDDKNSEYYFNFSAQEKYIYGIKNILTKSGAQVVLGSVIEHKVNGIKFIANGFEYEINLQGEFNVPNALSAIAVGKSQNISEEKIFQGLESVKLVEGRMEFIEEGQDFKVVVDYAHEPLSLQALFEALRALVLSNSGRVIGIIGSDGGGRDVGKRFEMGKIAGALCDEVVITDVNCFDEDPSEIAQMLAEGARASGKIDNQNLFIEIDRRKAIELSFNHAKKGDIVAITAKGTEPCIVVKNGQKIPWDDRRVAREVLWATKL